MNYHLLLILAMAFILPGCGGCGKASPKDFFTDSDVIALAKAAAKGDIETIDRLIEKGVDVNAKGKDNVTPLLFALKGKNKKGFLRLLEHGADPNIQNERGDSVMSLACLAKDDSDWLKMVLKHKGNPNLVDPVAIIGGDETPLFHAVDGRNIKNMELLIEAGANLNHQDKSNYTPSMYAAGNRQYKMVYLLLQKGADWRLVNKHGQDLAFTCMSYKVMQNDFPEVYRYQEKVLDFLRQKGVDLEEAQRKVDKHMGRK